jgi:hypothetical protein
MALWTILSFSEDTGGWLADMPELQSKERAGYRNYQAASVMPDTDDKGAARRAFVSVEYVLPCA